MTTETTAEPKLYRSDDGRIVGGVARGLAQHLRVPVWWVRLAFVALTFVAGAGLVLYGALWIVVPVQPMTVRDPRTSSTPTLLLGVGAVVVGAVLLLQFLDVLPPSATPVVLVVVGATLVWLRSDDEQRRQFTLRATGRAGPRRGRWPQVVIGGFFVLVGVAGFLAAQGSLIDVGRVLLAGLIVTLGVAVLAAPWALALLRDRDEERRARIRGEERADIAAHVHDSVLQTLTLIQRNSSDPAAVARLARAQERDLRRWLYEPVPNPSNTVRGALESVVGEIEDDHGVPIELVCVADATLDDGLRALVQAAREAMVNAAKYGGSKGIVSVYAEAVGGEVVVYVRDRGPGFDLAAVPEDRRGVRDSIIARMQRHGGSATVRPMNGAGTQVELRMKVTQ